MRRLSFLLLIVLAGCHTCPTAPAPPPLRSTVKAGQRPQDMTDRILGDDKYADWLKRNYSEWVRYAYDLESLPERR